MVAAKEDEAADAAQGVVDATDNYNATSTQVLEAQEKAEELRKVAEGIEKLGRINAATYFQAMGATDAYKILTDPEISKYLDDVDLEADWSSTSVENMVLALHYMQESNELRASYGLEPLKVSDSMFAAAMVNADHLRAKWGHSGQWPWTAENIAMGYSGPPGTIGSPFRGWFDKEETLWFEAIESDEYPPVNGIALKDMTINQVSAYYPALFNQVGHYLNIIQDNYKYTGFGVAEGRYYVQLFKDGWWGASPDPINLGSGRVMTIEDYLDNLNEYIDSNPGEPADGGEAQRAYEAALAELAEAEVKLSEAQESLDAAKEAREEADRAVTEALDNQQTANQKLADAVNAVTTATDEQVAAEEEMDKAYKNLTAAQDKANQDKAAEEEAAQKVAEAESNYATANADVTTAQGIVDELTAQKQEADDKVDHLENAEQYLQEAQEAKDQAEGAYNQAEQAYNNAAAKSQESYDKWVEASEKYEEAHEAFLKVVDAEGALEAAKAAVEASEAEQGLAADKLQAAKDKQATATENLAAAQESYEAAKAELEELKKLAEKNTAAAQLELDKALANLQAALDKYNAAKEALALANEDVALAQKTYDEALKRLKDLLAAQEEVEGAIEGAEEAGAAVVHPAGFETHSKGKVTDSAKSMSATYTKDLPKTGMDDMLILWSMSLLLLGSSLVVVRRKTAIK